MKSEVQHLRLPIREATTCACTVGSRSLWLLVLIDLFDLCRLEESHLTAAVLQSLRSCAAARARRCRCRRSPCRGCAAGHADRATATWVSHGRVGRLDAHRRKALNDGLLNETQTWRSARIESAMKRPTAVLLCLLVTGIIAAAVLIFHQISMATHTQATRGFRRSSDAAATEPWLRSLHLQQLGDLSTLEVSRPKRLGDLPSTTTMSCPTYAGPGFSQAAAAFEPTEGVTLGSPYEGTPVPPLGVLRLFPLRNVRLLSGTAQWSSMQVNLKYLLSIRVDDLLYAWRQNAKLAVPPGSRPAGGWEAPDMELRGHFLGHYLSATAMAWAGTNDTTLHRRMFYVVAAMDEVTHLKP